MKENIQNKLFEEQLRKFKHRIDYKINESPKYHPLITDGEEFDGLPDSMYMTRDGQPVPTTPTFTNEAGEQEDAPKPEGAVPPEPTNDQPVGMNMNAPKSPEAPVPAFDQGNDPNAPANPMGADMTAPPEQKVNDIQNEIIKHNIEAMKSIHDQLENLNQMIQQLNSKTDVLTADVEEVREPTNSEKLMNKTKVSYPYYFNLNDMWSDSWFNQQREKEVSKGIKEMPDGSYVADFDDLPQKSKIDIQNSFNEVN